MQGAGHRSEHLFRPAKRRKFYRKRTDTDEQDTTEVASNPPTPASETQTVRAEPSRNGQPHNLPERAAPEDSSAVAELIRQRKSLHRRKGAGIGFTNLDTSTARPTSFLNQDVSAGAVDETPAKIRSVIERFAPQTGQVSEVTDKHMYAPSIPRLFDRMTRGIY